MKDLKSYFRRRPIKDPSEEEIQAIYQTARERFGSDFPNPKRKDCPPKESFEKIISEKTLPNEDLRNHLFSCSECFSEYRNLMEQPKPAEAAYKPAAFSFPLKLVLTGTLALCLLSFGIWRYAGSRNSELVSSGNSPVNQNSVKPKETIFPANTADGNSLISSTAPPENSASKLDQINKNAVHRNKGIKDDKNEKNLSTGETEQRLLAKNGVEIDLNNPAIYRGAADATNRKTVQLNSVETTLRLKLPKENPAGVYEVFVADEFGKALTEKKIVRARNRDLFLQLDLRNINGSQKRLCFAPAGEIPDCVSINIVAKKE